MTLRLISLSGLMNGSMIRHIVLFKFKPEFGWDDQITQLAERKAVAVGSRVPDLQEWQTGRNISVRPAAYDFAVMGLLADEDALQRYLDHPFHQESVRLWRTISDWVVADLLEQPISSL